MEFIHKFIIAYGVHHLFTTSVDSLLFLVFTSPKKEVPVKTGTATKTNCYMRNKVYSKELCKNAFLFSDDRYTIFEIFYIIHILY